MNPLVVFGAGELAEMVAYCFMHDSSFDVVAYAVDGRHRREDRLNGLPVVAFEALCETHPPPGHALFVAVGPHSMNGLRAQRCESAQNSGYRLASYVSSKARTWANLSVGANVFIDQGTDIHPFVRIGAGTILSGCRIAHHCDVQDYCLMSGATLGGGVRVGERTFIGMGATVTDHVTIGRRNLVGAGTLILRDTPDDAVYRERATPVSRAPSSRVRPV